MAHYLAVTWNQDSDQQELLASGLIERICNRLVECELVLSVEGTRVWAESPSPYERLYCLAGSEGVILGTLFAQDAPNEEARFCAGVLGARVEREICDTKGRSLTTKFWGRYVAFIRDKALRATRVVRDPSGRISCFHVVCDGLDVFFSDINDCTRLGITFEIDWTYVAAHLSTWLIEGERTMFRGVTRILRGASAWGTPHGVVSEQLWSPWQAATAVRICDARTAASVLVRSIEGCVRAWASLHKVVGVHLSGGLDSSIIMSCLSVTDVAQAVFGLNYRSIGPDCDERLFAQKVADLAGRPLIARELPWQVDLTMMRKGKRAISLDFNPLRCLTSRQESQLAQELGASLILSGGGGDQMFCTGSARLGVADFLRENGIRRDFFKTVLIAALLERKSVYSVMRTAITLGLSRARYNPLQDHFVAKKLISTRAKESAESTVAQFHSWARFANSVPPGKLFQIAALAGRDMNDPFVEHGDPDLIEPLMDAPVANVCLAIPAYLFCANGEDRGLVKDAFAHKLPAEVRSRRSKGSNDESMRAMFRYNVDFAKSMLKGGLLEQNGMLDNGAVDRFLCDDPASPVMAGDAFHVLATEVRLRMWLDPGS
jgi:asparagine synthase (glutamine-hydrolysing)